MDIKSLSQDIRKYLRSGININSVAQCVMELVLNSLDAKSTSIAVRINLQTFRIQVVDNGIGITKSNMNLIGIRYMTSKCQSIEDLKRIKTFGFRGESLASIRNMSKKVIITSRPDSIENTYSKTYNNSKWGTVESVKQRPSQGTTVTIEGFMYNMPVRQKRINQTVDLHEIKKNLKCLAIIHSNVSFNIRNDATGKIVFQCNKSQTVSQTLTALYPDIIAKDLMDFRIAKGKIKVSGFIYRSSLNNSKIQFVYLNKRPIVSQKIQNLINYLLNKSLIFENGEKLQYPVYIMNISCPYSEIDLTLSPSKKTIEFKRWDIILKCIEKAITKLLEQENLIDPCAELPKDDIQEVISVHSNYGISQMKDAVKSVPVKKRKIVKPNTELSNNQNIKRKLWNVDETLLLEKEIKIDDKKGMNTSGSSIDAKGCNEKIVTIVNIHPENNTKIANDDNKDNNRKKIKSIMKVRNKSKSTDKPTEALIENITDLIGIENNQHELKIDKGNLEFQNNKNDEGRDNNNLIPFFNKHKNTQSLVLNSDINSSKPAYSWLNSNINTNVLEDQEKGKNLIMDMFLKSTLLFRNETPETNDEDKKKKFASNPNTTMMTMSVKFLSKRTIVTNSIRDWNLSNKLNQNHQVDNNENKAIEKCGLREEQKVSKCIQTTMIEHQNEFQLNFNYVQPQKNNVNPKFDIYNMKNTNFNVTFSKFFKQSHQKNKYNKIKTNNYYDKYPCFQDNFDHHQNYFHKNKNFDFNIGSNECKNDFRKPIRRYFSDYNFDFSNFSNFNKPYKQFINSRNNLFHKNKFFPTLNKMKDCTNQQNHFFGNQDDFTIPLYQSYNPYKSNKFNEFDKSRFIFQNQQQQPMYYNHNNNPKMFALYDEELYKSVTRDINLHDNTNFYGDLKCNGLQFEKPKNNFLRANCENYRECHQKFCGRAKYCTCNQVSTEDRCFSPYFKKPLNKNKFSYPKTNNNYQNSCGWHSNCHFHNYCNYQDNVHYTSPYFQKSTLNQHPTDERETEQYIKTQPQKSRTTHHKEMNFQPKVFSIPTYTATNEPTHLQEMQFFKPSKKSSRRLTGIFPLPERKQPNDYFPLISSTNNKFQNPFLQNKFLKEKSSIAVKQNFNYHQNSFLFGQHKRRRFKQKSSKLRKAKHSCRKINTEPLRQNPSTDHFSISNLNKPQNENLQVNFRKFYSEPFQVFNNENSFVNPNKDHEFSFLTPNINKSTTISDDSMEEINLVDTSEDMIDSTVCFENFKPKLSSTQYFNETDVSEIVAQSSILNSNVVDETPNKDLENFFVPSLALPSQKPVNTTNKNLFDLNEPNEKENNKCSSIMEISFDKTKKSKPFGKSCSSDCKSNQKSKSNDSQQMKIDLKDNFIFPKLVTEEGDNIANEWIKKTDSFGNAFYVHKRTGMTSVHSPKHISNFDFVKRIEFIPKGLSPVLVETKKVDKSLSPTSKKSLYATIMENYEKELNTIKWSNYINDYKDANRFFEELYREQARQFESLIPNINVSDLPRSMKRLYSKSHGESFTKDIFVALTVVGQLDKKFIVALSKSKSLIILFDQHAVHERIRLEGLFKDYTEAKDNFEKLKFKSSKCPRQIALNLMEIDINILINSRKLFEDLGLTYVIFESSLKVTHIPTCMYNKFIKNEQCNNNKLENILTSLIYEHISTILSTRGAVTKVPNILQNIINLEACRGAIKFGDKLTASKCEELIKQLSDCNLPYQCAHGRPTLVPLIDINDTSVKPRKPNLKKLSV